MGHFTTCESDKIFLCTLYEINNSWVSLNRVYTFIIKAYLILILILYFTCTEDKQIDRKRNMKFAQQLEELEFEGSVCYHTLHIKRKSSLYITSIDPNRLVNSCFQTSKKLELSSAFAYLEIRHFFTGQKCSFIGGPLIVVLDNG